MTTLQITLKPLPTQSHILASEKTQLLYQIETMMLMESKYKCNDLKKSNYNRAKAMGKILSKKRRVEAFMMNDKHRQDMCEWSYRIVDSFGGSRELVAIAQNYLDRFLTTYSW